MKVRTPFLTIAAGAALAIGALGVPATASAASWQTAISPNMSVSGTAQTAERVADWTKQVSAMTQLTGVKSANAAPLGFFEEAKSIRGNTAAGQVATR